MNLPTEPNNTESNNIETKEDRPPGSEWRERYRVRISFVFALLFIWRVQPRNAIFLVLGVLVSLAGLFLRQWSAGCVKKNDEVASTGPYALVRHPLYLGSFLIAAGLILGASSFHPSNTFPYLDRTLFFWSFLWILVDSIYWPKIRKEEENLKAKFGGQYEDYCGKVPRFWPKSWSWASLDFSTFSWELWKNNNEFSSLLGYLALAAILISRYFYR